MVLAPIWQEHSDTFRHRRVRLWQRHHLLRPTESVPVRPWWFWLGLDFQGTSIVNTRSLNAAGKGDVFDVANTNSITRMIKDDGRYGDYSPPYRGSWHRAPLYTTLLTTS